MKQVQAWLGHADPGFTLKTYIHLMDAGVGSAAFLDLAVATDAAKSPENRRFRSDSRGGDWYTRTF